MFNISTLKKLSAGLKIMGAVVSFAIICKYDSPKDKYSGNNKRYDW